MRIERWARAIGAFVLALVLAAPRLALAHAVGVSRGEWSLSGARVTGELAFARAELALSFPALDTNHDGTLDDAELASDGEALTREVIGGSRSPPTERRAPVRSSTRERPRTMGRSSAPRGAARVRPRASRWTRRFSRRSRKGTA